MHNDNFGGNLSHLGANRFKTIEAAGHGSNQPLDKSLYKLGAEG